VTYNFDLVSGAAISFSELIPGTEQTGKCQFLDNASPSFGRTFVIKFLDRSTFHTLLLKHIVANHPTVVPPGFVPLVIEMF
jgi:hypothetical protein